jgi:hypothetical protein
MEPAAAAEKYEEKGEEMKPPPVSSPANDAEF